ncbi:MAG: curved DNA-binding protein [Verrucomicrobiaceae bacterium]|nr:curved DNA-binding protein [Verrucomicrobiaceae bacterium]
MATNYHRILGVSADATPAALKAAFRKLAHRYHPDISTEKNATERFIEIVEAYRALTATPTPTTESVFKKTSSNRGTVFTEPSGFVKPAESTAFSGHNVKPSNGWSEQKSEQRKSHEKTADTQPESGPVKGKDCHIETHLSVEELYWGVQLKINPAAQCPGRRTKKEVNATKLLNLKIHRGTRPGTRLCLRGKGEPGKNGGSHGDIYLTLKLKPHERYEVQGDHLYIDMPMTRWEAQQGAFIDLVTPGGRIEVDVPAGISSGQTVRIPRRGLPKGDDEYGDVVAVARLVDISARTEHMHKWPHVSHPETKRWRPVEGTRGNTIDVRI